MSKFSQELKTTTQLAIPLIAAFLGQKGLQLVDVIMMGRIGTDALAAGALGTGFFMTILVFCIGTISAVGVFISRSIGSEQLAEVVSSLQHGLVLALLIALPCMILIWYAPPILIALGEDPKVVAGTQLFLHSLVWGFPGLLGFFVLREFVAALKLTRMVLMVTIAAIPLAIALNYILIYGKFGLPALGIAGIGYAGTIIYWLMFISLLGYCFYQPTLRSYLAKLQFKTIDGRKLREMFHIGAPSGLLYVFDVAMVFMAVIMMGHFGETALAAHQIAIMCASTAYCFPFALSMTTALRVSHAAGAKDSPRIKLATYLGLGLSFIAALIIALIFLFIPDKLVHFFLSHNAADNPTIQQLAASLVRIAALFQFCDALQSITAGALRGLKDTWIPMLMSIFSYWVLGVGGSYVLAFYTPLGVQGIWYGLTLGISGAGVILAFRLCYRYQLEKAHY